MRWATKVPMKFILMVSLLFTQCNDEEKRNLRTEANHKVYKPDTLITGKMSTIADSLPTAMIGETDSFKAKRNKLTTELLKKIRTVEVLTVENDNTRIASTGEDLGDQCDKWSLDKAVIKNIIKASKPISGEVWHYLYDVWPCNMRGKILLNLDTFSYEVNPGSYVVISNRDTSFYYGCTDKKYEKYFLSKVWDPTKEE